MMSLAKPAAAQAASHIDNPWVQQGCREHEVPGNRLPTHLQEQYGQLGEDLILEGVLKSHFARLGLPLSAIRYAEVGANHPIQTSNTYLFAHKWKGRGVLVEANPALLPALREVRADDQVLHFAVVPPGFPDEVRINIASHHELSSVDLGHVRSFGALGQVEGAVQVPTVTLDELLGTCFPQGLHLLSIDIEGLDLQVLEQSTFSQRPTFVVTEPSRHYHAEAEAAFGRVMNDKGYVEVARTDYNLIYGDTRQIRSHVGAMSASTPRTVRTFDIFDTLIARRCVHPHQIHVDVEIRSQVKGFARARVAAEAAVAHHEHGLQDIYGELQRQQGFTDEQIQDLMALEIQSELDHVVPIADGMRALDRDSVLITDMYLPETVIRAMLRRAGLMDDLPIVRSNAGKKTGDVWRALADKGVVARHRGDNVISDVQTCRTAGMQATLTRQHEPTVLEKTLYVNGFVQLSNALRAARLGTASEGLPDWAIKLQCALNMPVLTVCAFYLRALTAGSQFDQILFSSRDCRALQALYEGLATSIGGEQPQARYWYTSRLARSNASPDYQAYCKGLLQSPSILVDLCGTGLSLSRLFDRLNLPEHPQVFLCEWVDAADYRQKMEALLDTRGEGMSLQSLFQCSTFCDNNWLEWLNLSPEGMVVDVAQVLGCAVPLRDATEWEPDQADWVARQSRYVTAFIQQLHQQDLVGAYLEVSQKLPQLIDILRENLADLRTEGQMLQSMFRDSHWALDAQILNRLARL